MQNKDKPKLNSKVQVLYIGFGFGFLLTLAPWSDRKKGNRDRGPGKT